MDPHVIDRLLRLNRDFYRRFAVSFSESRSRPNPGFFKVIDHLNMPNQRLLDVGCGDGRFGRFLSERDLVARYEGVDNNPEFLEIARLTTNGSFWRRDLAKSDCLADIGVFENIVCLSTLQHIPNRERRIELVGEMAAHLTPSGRLTLSCWQFMESRRQRKKIVPWNEVGLSDEDVEPNDYLVSWQRNGKGVRYVTYLDLPEVKAITTAAGLDLFAHFLSDGKEGNLNLYTVHELSTTPV